MRCVYPCLTTLISTSLNLFQTCWLWVKWRKQTGFLWTCPCYLMNDSDLGEGLPFISMWPSVKEGGWEEHTRKHGPFILDHCVFWNNELGVSSFLDLFLLDIRSIFFLVCYLSGISLRRSLKMQLSRQPATCCKSDSSCAFLIPLSLEGDGNSP